MLFISLLVFVSCGTKNSKAQTNQLQQNIVQTHDVERVVHKDTSFLTVFLDYEFSGEVQVFDKPNGMIVKTVKNNFEAEDNIMFDLLERNDSMFYVVVYWSMYNEFVIKGWICKSKYISIHTRANDAVNRPLILYKNPDNTSQIVAIDKEYNPEVYEVIDFKGRWLKIKAKINGKIYEGWIPPDMQCSNVYSTCS